MYNLKQWLNKPATSASDTVLGAGAKEDLKWLESAREKGDVSAVYLGADTKDVGEKGRRDQDEKAEVDVDDKTYEGMLGGRAGKTAATKNKSGGKRR